MLKIMLYAYTRTVFSSHKVKKLLNESIRMVERFQNQTLHINQPVLD